MDDVESLDPRIPLIIKPAFAVTVAVIISLSTIYYLEESGCIKEDKPDSFSPLNTYMMPYTVTNITDVSELDGAACACSINSGPWQYTIGGTKVTKEVYDAYQLSCCPSEEKISYYIQVGDENWTLVSSDIKPSDAGITVERYGP